YTDGSFVQAVNVAANPEWRNDLDTPAETAFAIRVITKIGGGANTTWTFYDKDIHPISSHADPVDTFDPRYRPWYLAAVNAGKTVSVGPYVSASTRLLTMTLATPAGPGNHVVIAADVLLLTLGEIVDVSSLSKQALGYVFDPKGRLIAHSDKTVMND